MNIKSQIRELGRNMQKRKVYTLQVRKGTQAYGTFISQNIDEVLKKYTDELKKATDKGLYVEHGLIKKTDYGRTVLHCFITKEASLITEWSVLEQES